MSASTRFPERAIIREVGLRDGLQSIAAIMPTARKIEWIKAAHAAGQREIEVGSFVPARLLPQLADTGGARGVRQDPARIGGVRPRAQPEGRREGHRNRRSRHARPALGKPRA